MNKNIVMLLCHVFTCKINLLYFYLLNKASWHFMVIMLSLTWDCRQCKLKDVLLYTFSTALFSETSGSSEEKHISWPSKNQQLYTLLVCQTLHLPYPDKLLFTCSWCYVGSVHTHTHTHTQASGSLSLWLGF